MKRRVVFTVYLNELITGEESEILEDCAAILLAILLENLGYGGEIVSNITGNITTFPFAHKVNGAVLYWLLRVTNRLNTILGYPS